MIVLIGFAFLAGIITGFVVSFTVIALALSSIVQASGISGDTLRLVAATLILIFGMVLLIPPLKKIFTALAGRLTINQKQATPGTKPKAGYGSVLITLAYTMGTSIPMMAIMLGGRSFLNRFPVFTKHADTVQRIFGIVMIATAIALYTGFDHSVQTWLLETFPGYGEGLTSIEENEAVREALKQLPE